QRFSQFEILSFCDLLAGLIGSKMMRLIEHNQIPARCFQYLLEACRSLESVDARDQTVVLGERIGLPICNVALAAEYFEIQMKSHIQLSLPVVHKAGGHNHQSPRQFTARCEFSEHERSLDSLSQSDAIGNQESA